MAFLSAFLDYIAAPQYTRKAIPIILDILNVLLQAFLGTHEAPFPDPSIAITLLRAYLQYGQRLSQPSHIALFYKGLQDRPIQESCTLLLENLWMIHLTDPYWEIRDSALESICALYKPGLPPERVSLLLTLIRGRCEDEEAYVRVSALKAWSMMVSQDFYPESLKETILRAIHDPDSQVRAMAIALLVSQKEILPLR